MPSSPKHSALAGRLLPSPAAALFGNHAVALACPWRNEKPRVLWRCRNCTDKVVEPTLGNLECELRRAACADRKKVRVLVRHEFDVDWQASLVNQLAAKPLVEDVFDAVAVPAVFHTQSNRMCRFQKSFERLPVANHLAIRKSFPRRCRDCNEDGQKGTLLAAVRPKQQGILDPVLYAHPLIPLQGKPNDNLASAESRQPKHGCWGYRIFRDASFESFHHVVHALRFGYQIPRCADTT